MTIPEYDEECDCEFCKEEREKRKMTSSSEQPKEQQQREGKAYYHSDITPEVLENIQIGDWIRGIGDISCPFDQRVVQTVGTWLRMHDTRSRPHPCRHILAKSRDAMTPPAHINPGTDTTINPVVIDDSYREKKPEYDPIFIGLINYFKEIQWQRVESEISVTEIIEILTDFAKMEAEEKASHTSAPSPQDAITADEVGDMMDDVASACNKKAQQRVDAAIKELQYVVRADVNEDTECHILKAIALLQAGDPK